MPLGRGSWFCGPVALCATGGVSYNRQLCVCGLELVFSASSHPQEMHDGVRVACVFKKNQQSNTAQETLN